MISISTILSIADFWGWMQIIGSILGVIFIYRYKNTLAQKYIKTIEKDVYKSIGIPAQVLFDFNQKKIKNNKTKNSFNKTKFEKQKRNVSELSKKIVASRQKWRCKKCKELLDFTYEIDHIIPLYKGGGNELDNLRALCRNCHGRKSLIERFSNH